MAWVVPAAAAAIGGVGAYKETSAANKALQANAEALRREATMAKQQALDEEVKLGMRTRGLIGAQKAAFGASGVDISGGTPLDIFEETEKFGRMDALTLRKNTSERMRAYDTQIKGIASQTQSPMFNAGKTILTSLATSKALSSFGGGSAGKTSTTFKGGKSPVGDWKINPKYIGAA